MTGLQASMHRHTQSGSGKQIPLSFNLMPNTERELILRAAYRRLELSRRLSFEQAMSDRIYSIGIRNLADAITRRRVCTNSSNCTPGTDAIAKDMDRLFSLWPEINYFGPGRGDG